MTKVPLAMTNSVKFPRNLDKRLDEISNALWDVEFRLTEAMGMLGDAIAKAARARFDVGLIEEYLRDALGAIRGGHSSVAHAHDEKLILEGRQERPKLGSTRRPTPPASTKGGGK